MIGGRKQNWSIGRPQSAWLDPPAQRAEPAGCTWSGAIAPPVSPGAAGSQPRNRVRCRVVAACMASGHTITIIAANRHIEVSVGGQKLAESDRALRLDETGLPPRYYIPRQDVRTELLRPTARKTTCPFKGQASYWSVQVGGEIYKNLVWSYETPIPQAGPIAGLMCFYDERVELTIGDEHQPGPKTSSWR
jgi:uncharacterized protein (DUF427 family)